MAKSILGLLNAVLNISKSSIFMFKRLLLLKNQNEETGMIIHHAKLFKDL